LPGSLKIRNGFAPSRLEGCQQSDCTLCGPVWRLDSGEDHASQFRNR
jgi:hypothetical protein